MFYSKKNSIKLIIFCCQFNHILCNSRWFFLNFFLDFDSSDLSGSGVFDSDYLTMLSSSDKLMSGEFEGLERLQAELDLFDDPNRPEEIVEQMAVENHLDLIEEEVCSDTGDVFNNETLNIKIEPVEELKTSIESEVLQEIKSEPIDVNEVQQENVVVSLKQSQQQPEVVTVQSATKRSAPSSAQGNPQSKKPVRQTIKNHCTFFLNIFINNLLTFNYLYNCFSYLQKWWLTPYQVQVLEEVINKFCLMFR